MESESKRRGISQQLALKSGFVFGASKDFRQMTSDCRAQKKHAEVNLARDVLTRQAVLPSSAFIAHLHVPSLTLVST